MYFYYYVYVFLLLCMFYSVYSAFIVSFYVLFVCKCVLYYCHRVATQLQFTNISTCLCMTTLTEVFPSIFLSFKANARVKPAKTGQGPHSS